MVEKQYKIAGEEGLHARPASVLVGAASSFQSDVSLQHKEKKVNLKSILGVMSLGIKSGETVTISADGADEQEAIDRIDEVVKSEGIGTE
ncbi:phosphocarrier protein HPr [Planococcus lenghuensis]|uniref:Phosphocarrier protein HPr n=1 Tax=Planococcus lenghuensis TaxID=2213202 RepID=A0A1Q2KYZ6_9BACL|nr:phosphocarrier protein HPr [Planococcus lenghuensis]AQQ53430.1 phosphocarrier protein HPr [Planococcus lenghuensis]